MDHLVRGDPCQVFDEEEKETRVRFISMQSALTSHILVYYCRISSINSLSISYWMCVCFVVRFARTGRRLQERLCKMQARVECESCTSRTLIFHNASQRLFP